MATCDLFILYLRWVSWYFNDLCVSRPISYCICPECGGVGFYQPKPKDVGQDGLSGKIVFHGIGDSVSFEVEMEVEFTSAGSREITLHGKVSSGLETMQFENMLQEAAGGLLKYEDALQ